MNKLIAACALALFALGAPMSVSAQVDPASVARQGAGYIPGAWHISGQYDQIGQEPVGFRATFAPDGTFVDRDGYPGRWIISGATFAMFYPDESQLGYVGTIDGDTISGRFEGLSNSGSFQMQRARQ